MRVLHVAESLGGGVATAMQDYALATPEIRHDLLGVERSGEFNRSRSVGFESIRVLSNTRQLPLTLRGVVRETSPDLVHLHSTGAGVVGRFPSLRGHDVPLVYTPHCYGFERLDIPPATRRFLRFIESLLAPGTDALVACSPREADLSRSLGHRNIIYVPNCASRFYAGTHRVQTQTPRVVMLGRIAPQKDPRYFAEFATELRRLVETEMVWIGDGDARYRRELEEAGVVVTGWLDQDAVREQLAVSTLYAHSAAWEGFPIALLEAASVGLNVIARQIPALGGLPPAVQASDPSALARLASQVLGSDEHSQANLSAWNDVLGQHAPNNQAVALRQAYRVALGSRHA